LAVRLTDPLWHPRNSAISASAIAKEGERDGMQHLWIVLAAAGAFFQAIRTAGQRDLNKHLSTMATTYVRSLFGLPLLAIYLAVVMVATGDGLPAFGAAFLTYTFAGAMAQVIATALLIRMFTLRNFGVGTMLTKIDVVITAILGALFFSESPSLMGAVALGVITAGVLLMSLERTQRVGALAAAAPGNIGAHNHARGLLADKSLVVALACAVTFSIAFLTYREAALAIGPGSFLWRGAWTVLLAILMQTVVVGLWLAWREPGLTARLQPHLRLSAFIGVTSAVGSICWFTAFALQSASYVRAVGQVEVVFTLVISAFYYRERISVLELSGIALTVAGVLLFRLVV
jgi:drug/metabolite transporter (DMT)-like permease